MGDRYFVEYHQSVLLADWHDILEARSVCMYICLERIAGVNVYLVVSIPASGSIDRM